jgi:hypothetical protein
MKRCAAVLIVTASSGDLRRRGLRCPDPCDGSSDFCWTHHRAVMAGTRTRADVLNGVAVPKGTF